MPVSPSADTSLEVPQDLMYACSTCAYVTKTLSNLRRHQTTAHQRIQFRSSLGHATSCAVNGLPQCIFCFQAFTTLRQFQNHLDRQCCQVRPCDRSIIQPGCPPSRRRGTAHFAPTSEPCSKPAAQAIWRSPAGTCPKQGLGRLG